MVDVYSQVSQNPEQSRSQVVRPNEQVIHFILLRYLWVLNSKHCYFFLDL